ncbi:MAG: hypothetical protein QNJ07_02340 [Woeseiaceae bacterium]|nr:hypothetical protein [Woeseiaceae bacterium]
MSNRNKTAQEFVSGRKRLPAEFTTAYKRDIETAREIIRLRREDKKRHR